LFLLVGIIDTSYQAVRLTTRLIAGKACKVDEVDGKAQQSTAIVRKALEISTRLCKAVFRAITKAYDSNVELYELSIYRAHMTPEKD
jgi:hypothetical protein